MRWVPLNYSSWNRWFAWYPVEIEGEVCWLECVYRKSINWHPDAGYLWIYKKEFVE